MNDDGYTRITLRMPNDLHAKLTAEASRTSKSMNAEIVGRLESSFAQPESAFLSTAEDPISRLVVLRSLAQDIEERLRRFEAAPNPSDLERIDMDYHRIALKRLRHFEAEAFADLSKKVAQGSEASVRDMFGLAIVSGVVEEPTSFAEFKAAVQQSARSKKRRK